MPPPTTCLVGKVQSPVGVCTKPIGNNGNPFTESAWQQPRSRFTDGLQRYWLAPASELLAILFASNLASFIVGKCPRQLDPALAHLRC
jgi:hypothetical protein